MFAIYRQPEKEPLPSPDPIGQCGIFHTQDHPFCDSPHCRCHGSSVLLQRLRIASHNGLISSADSVRIVRGGTC